MTAPVDLDKLDRLRAWATQGKLYMDPYHHSDGSISYDLSIGEYESNLDKPEKGNRKSLAELIVALVNAYPDLAAELRELRVKVVRDHVPVPVSEIIHRLEGEAGNTDTDPRWVAATALRRMAGWETRTLMCQIDESEPIVRTRGPK